MRRARGTFHEDELKFQGIYLRDASRARDVPQVR